MINGTGCLVAQLEMGGVLFIPGRRAPLSIAKAHCKALVPLKRLCEPSVCDSFIEEHLSLCIITHSWVMARMMSQTLWSRHSYNIKAVVNGQSDVLGSLDCTPLTFQSVASIMNSPGRCAAASAACRSALDDTTCRQPTCDAPNTDSRDPPPHWQLLVICVRC